MEINRSIDTNPSPEKREGRQRLVPSAGARAHLIIKVENRTVHCTPLASDRRTVEREEEEEEGTDRFRALAPRSPARLARSNDPHPVQCNGIALPNPPSSGRRFPAAATAKKGWKRLCVRGSAAQGVGGCLDVAYRPLSESINHRQRGGVGKKAIVKYNPSFWFSLSRHPLQSSWWTSSGIIHSTGP